MECKKQTNQMRDFMFSITIQFSRIIKASERENKKLIENPQRSLGVQIFNAATGSLRAV